MERVSIFDRSVRTEAQRKRFIALRNRLEASFKALMIPEDREFLISTSNARVDFCADPVYKSSNRAVRGKFEYRTLTEDNYLERNGLSIRVRTSIDPVNCFQLRHYALSRINNNTLLQVSFSPDQLVSLSLIVDRLVRGLPVPKEEITNSGFNPEDVKRRTQRILTQYNFDRVEGKLEGLSIEEIAKIRQLDELKPAA